MSAYEISPLTSLWHLAAATLVLFGPGLAWLAWTPAGGRDAALRLADALGLSLALTALAGLAAFLAGWRVTGPALVGLYLTVGVAALVPGARRWLGHGALPARESPPAGAGPNRLQRVWLLLVILGLVAALAWRLFQVRDLVLPAWVDPLHHVLIVRLILENGGLPATFEPYMPVPFYYHFAYHMVTAGFAFWSRLDAAAAALLMGQALNALVSLGVYRLGAALWGGWRRAAAAALLVAFATQMPAYYATWGRYTLLAGLVLLPIAMAAAVEIAQLGPSRERLARLALLTAGALLSHYFAALLLALFLLAQGVLLVAARGSRARRLLPLVIGGGAGLALAAPWLARVLRFAGSFASVRVIAPSQSLDEFYFGDYLNYLSFLMGPTRNHLLLILGALGLVLAGWQVRSRSLSLWTLGLAAIALPWGPQLNPFRPDHAVIVLFLPASLHLADGLVSAWERLRAARLAWAGGAAAVVVMAVLLGWGLRDTRDIINPVTILARAPDLQAIRWIEGHTPPQARFYINAALWQYGHYRGVDGGWWITPLTGRPTLIPPALYAFGPAEYAQQVDALGRAAAGLQGCTPGLEDLLREAGLDYVYLGLNPGTLTPEQLQDCSFLQPVYQQGGVSIYAYFLP